MNYEVVILGKLAWIAGSLKISLKKLQNQKKNRNSRNLTKRSKKKINETFGCLKLVCVMKLDGESQ